HLGLRFDPGFKGPGLKVKDVLPEGPADKKKHRVKPGETVVSIDGQKVDSSIDLTKVLNGAIDRDIRLVVRTSGTAGLSKKFRLVGMDRKGDAPAEGKPIPKDAEGILATLRALKESSGKKSLMIKADDVAPAIHGVRIQEAAAALKLPIAPWPA